MEDKTVSSILNSLKSRLDLKTDIELAKWLGVAQNTLSAWRLRGTSPYGAIAEAALLHGVSLDYLLAETNCLFPWRIPQVVYFDNKDEPRHLDAMNENLRLALAYNPNVTDLRGADVELLLVTDDGFPPAVGYGDQVIMRRLHVTDPIVERGYYYVLETQEGDEWKGIVEIIPTLPRGSAKIVYKDRTARNIVGRSSFDGVYGQLLGVLKPLAMETAR